MGRMLQQAPCWAAEKGPAMGQDSPGVQARGGTQHGSRLPRMSAGGLSPLPHTGTWSRPSQESASVGCRFWQIPFQLN